MMASRLIRWIGGRARGARSPLLALVGLALLASCSPPAPAPTALPQVASTPAPTLTPTTNWFPATTTATPAPTRLASTATPFVQAINKGSLILQDDFSDQTLWQTLEGPNGNIAYGNHELSLAIAQPRASLTSFRDKLTVDNFYLEIDANPRICQGNDQFGVLFRAASTQDYYRYLMTCNYQVRLERIRNAEASVVQDWTPVVGLTPGPIGIYRLGVWALGNDLRFYVDGVFQFTRREPTFASGGIGLFARSMGDTIVTIEFSNLQIWQPAPVTLATPTP